MAFKPTEEQKSAIYEKGNVLVSAAAGSGKTAVLVERVINMLIRSENPVAANRLLIVTFTNLAANEMRTRIEKRLEEECKSNPDDAWLMRQRLLLPSAKICTIDSFCIELIRENFEMAGISPDFKITSGADILPLSQKALSELTNRYLEENNPVFMDLLDITGAEFDEKPFWQTVSAIYEYSRQMPFPDLYLDSLVSVYKMPFNRAHPWQEYVFKRAYEIAASVEKPLERGMTLAEDYEKGAPYKTALLELKEGFLKIQAAVDEGDWDKLYLALSDIIIPRAPSVRGIGELPDLMTVKQIFRFVADTIAELKGLVYCPRIEIEAQNDRLRAPLELLVEFIKEYADMLIKEQFKENLLTFHNTEQLALQMLCEYKDGSITVRPEAQRFLDSFDEVLVDEYQDTNDLQDTLFKIISDKERKLFIVGDVKQSIYGFRGANPNNFLNKKKRCQYDKFSGGFPKGIVLSKNFRSRKEICEFINFFFSNLMTAETGEIVYDESEHLVAGADFPEIDVPAVDIHFIDRVKEAEDGALRIVYEARHIADYIKKTMSLEGAVRENADTLRKAKYSDFAILLRATKDVASVIAAELLRQGIPVNSGSEDYLETVEVSTFLSLLQIIENPKCDIELLTAMMSPIFSFSAEEMALMRADNLKGDLISAVSSAASSGNKHAGSFLQMLSEYRRDAVTMPLSRFINHLLIESDYLNIVSSMADGTTRRANLLMLVSYAEKYSENASGGIGGFIRYLKSLPPSSIVGATNISGSDTVKILSMHASKGLQFPICIVANIASRINLRDTADAFLYSDSLGIGVRYFEECIKEKITNLGHILIADSIRQKSLEEELRLFYVALTRAEDKLLLVSGNDSLENKADTIGALLASADSSVNSLVFSKASHLSDWVIMTALLHPDAKELRALSGANVIFKDTESRIDVKIINVDNIPNNVSENLENDKAIPDLELAEKILKNISYKYPYEALRNIEAKSTVSALASKTERDRFAFTKRPAFMFESSISPAEIGTATHRVMEFIGFSENPNIDAELERLVEWQFLTEAEADSVDRKSLKKFFDSELYKRILNSKELSREMRFLTEVPAGSLDSSLDGNLKNESVVIQGAVDLCFAEDDGIVIVDFKTDRAHNEKELFDSYSEQLNIYAKACKKIFSKPVKEKIIYSFYLSKEIRVK